MARARLDPPEQCPTGHRLRVRAGYRVIWLPCLCAGGPGHHVWICGQCDVPTYVPPHTDDNLSTGAMAATAPTLVKGSTNLCAVVPAGQQRSRDLDRFITFVDAVAAVAITLLVLPLVELAGEFHSNRGSVGHLIATHGDRFWAFALSFVVIARLWWVQHEMMRPVIAENRYVVWCLLLWSLVIVFLPFPTALLPIGGDQAVTKILYIGALTLASTLLALLATAIGRSSSIRDTDAGPAVAPSAVTAALFAVALVISLTFPATGYYPLALLVLTDVAVEAIRRRFGSLYAN